MKLGCIADDFTGATDLANNLVRSGMRTVQTIGVPQKPMADDIDAVVVALKSRTIPVRDAIGQSLAALRWLRGQGAEQIYFKYCSTFDSTPQGNIGPVTDALMHELGCRFTIACPAFPENKRTVFKGHLFVGDVLLNESGMQHHPLTPMTDANLVRVLQAQTQQRVGLVSFDTVAQGAEAIRASFAQLQRDNVAIAIVDAISNEDLMRIGAACKGMSLVTAGSGVALGLVQNWPELQRGAEASVLPTVSGPCAIVSGSCSVATNGQVRHHLEQGRSAFAIDAMRVAAGEDVAGEALYWMRDKLGELPVLLYATAEAAQVKAVQERHGKDIAGERIERTLAAISRGLVERGVRRLIVAGGETSGACARALGITQMQIGPQIDPGVPWCAAQTAVDNTLIHIALKSGNFGTPDFFVKAFGTS